MENLGRRVPGLGSLGKVPGSPAGRDGRAASKLCPGGVGVEWTVIRIQSLKQHGDPREKGSLCLLLRERLLEKQLSVRRGLWF